MKLRVILFACFFIQLTLFGFAQDTVVVASVKADSSLVNETKFQDLVKESNEMRIMDSLQKMDLQNQISLLRESNSLKKEKLEFELRELATKDSLRKLEERFQIDSLKKTVIGYPVVPFRDTIFTIYVKSGSSRPEERASNVARKVQALYQDDFLVLDSIHIEETEYTIDIVYKDIIITSVSDMDAKWEGRPKAEIAAGYLEIIKASISNEQAENSLSKLMMRIGLVLLIACFIGLLIWGIRRLYTYVEKLIISQRDKRIKDLTIKDYTLISSKQGLRLALSVLNFFKWFFICFILFLTLPLVFSVFPFTHSWAEKLFSIVWSPFRTLFVSLWDYFPNLITIVIIYLIMRYFIRFVRYIFGEIDSGKLEITGFHRDWALPTFSIVKVLLYAFMVVLIFPHLPKSDSDVFKGVSVFVGILFSLGSSSAIANMIAGLVITYMRPFKVGDKITTGQMTGTVIEKTILVTRLKTALNEEVTIPNSAVLSGNTINYSTFSDTGIIVFVSVNIGYDVHWRKMHDALLEAASKVGLVLKDPVPFVLQTSLDDFYVSYTLNVYTVNPGLVDEVKSLLNQHIQDICAEKGIEIMSPHYQSKPAGGKIEISES